MIRRALVLLLVAGTVFAGPPSFRGSNASVGPSDLATSAAINLFVATTGNDSNACTDAAAPCLTFDGAYAKLPKTINHAVTVTVAAGSYAKGGTIAGFTFGPGGYLLTRGTRINATPATGTASGTFTAGSAGTSSSATWGTATDSGQSWATDNLRGKWVVISSGPGLATAASGSIRAITGNTGTVLTVAGNWTAPTSSSVYTIQEPGTIITGFITPPDLYTGSNTNTAAFILQNNSSSPATPSLTGQIIFQDLKITAGAAAFRQYASTRTTVERCWFAPSNAFSNAAMTVSGATSQLVALNDNYANYGASVFFFVSLAQMNFVTLNRNVVDGGTHILFHANDANFSTTQNSFKGQSGASIGLSGGTLARSNMTGDRIDCNSNGQPGISWAGGLPSAGLLYLFGVNISNCSDAINLAGPIVVELQSVAGTGNTVGMAVQRGASFHVNSATTLTGTTEVAVDGTSSDLATMRAATPKLVGNTNYGSKFWE